MGQTKEPFIIHVICVNSKDFPTCFIGFEIEFSNSLTQQSTYIVLFSLFFVLFSSFFSGILEIMQTHILKSHLKECTNCQREKKCKRCSMIFQSGYYIWPLCSLRSITLPISTSIFVFRLLKKKIEEYCNHHS